MTEPARATVWWNGIKVHDNVQIKANGGIKVTPEPGGLKLQSTDKTSDSQRLGA